MSERTIDPHLSPTAQEIRDLRSDLAEAQRALAATDAVVTAALDYIDTSDDPRTTPDEREKARALRRHTLRLALIRWKDATARRTHP